MKRFFNALMNLVQKPVSYYNPLTDLLPSRGAGRPIPRPINQRKRRKRERQ